MEERTGYVENGWLCHKLPLPIAYEKAEQIFAAQPQAHQMKFAETHQEIGDDVN